MFLSCMASGGGVSLLKYASLGKIVVGLIRCWVSLWDFCMFTHSMTDIALEGG